MRPARPALAIAMLVLFLAGTGQVAAESQPAGTVVTFPRDMLVIETAEGARHSFRIEKAETREQMSRGLMFREELSIESGMLFVHAEDDMIGMWMKNTLIPLDMLFIDRQGRIVHTHENAVPLSTDPISSTRPVAAVLEVPAGTVERLGLKPGDRVVHAAFDAAP